MNLLAFAGIRSRRSEAEEAAGSGSSADQGPLESLVDTAKAAHDHLRAHLKDPDFAGVLCQALGCRQGGCGATPSMQKRSRQIPRIVDQLAPPKTDKPL